MTYTVGFALDEMAAAWRFAEQCVAQACHRWQVPQQLWEDLHRIASRVPAMADRHTSVLLGQVIHGVLYPAAAVLFYMVCTLRLFLGCVTGISQQQLLIIRTQWLCWAGAAGGTGCCIPGVPAVLGAGA